MERPSPERIYGLRELTRILSLTPKRVAQLRRLDLLRRDSGYTFRDLLALRAASALLDAGASVRQIRDALTAIRKQDPGIRNPLTEVRLIVDGGLLLAQSDRVRFDPRSGQTVLALDTIDLTKAAQATLATGLVRPLQPPAEQAEVWFERASEWDADPVQWEDAIAAYRRVIAIDPTYAAAWNNLGLLLHRMGQYEDARKAYASALAQDPECAEAAYNLGSLDEDMGAVEEAIEHYRCALTIKPDYADAHDDLVRLAERERIDFTVVGPEAPLVAGLADRFAEHGLLVLGPAAKPAQLEGSKAYSKRLMARHAIPTARFETFVDPEEARRYCRTLGAPLVVKADGLAAGKGAIVCATLEEAAQATRACMEERVFGAAGMTVVVEEFLRGEEISFFALANGLDALPLGAAQDHKTVFDGDRGPNTGGMGAYSPVPGFDAALERRVMDTIVRPAITALTREGPPYRGVLFVGLMLTADGPKVLEYNCRL